MNDKSKTTSSRPIEASSECNAVRKELKNRSKKRKREDSESSDYEDVLPENTLEVEKNLHASAIKNNLDDISVRKILKKVVTNDHVLALVKLREEEDSGPEEDSHRPKLTRAKVKELMKVSPSSAAWNLELTPINHIPVKTRPEVKALIAQELPEDEDDEEYEPTHDDVPSDDDQGLETCSDLDSQPRTPATPVSQHTTSPKVVTDGPFKVPQELSAPAVRKLDLQEEATIARRTRSKLSLSTTTIEHIESTFIPPDDLPMPANDDLWSEFLSDCLNPASTSKNEDDDEADPEYNVAADADAHDEDEEALSNSIIKISKKELNDLVTELFNIMPDASVDDDLADNLASSVLTDNTQHEISATHWEGKQEPMSDDENRVRLGDKITFEKRGYTHISIGKTDIEDIGSHANVNAREIARAENAATNETGPVQSTVNGVTTDATGFPGGETNSGKRIGEVIAEGSEQTVAGEKTISNDKTNRQARAVRVRVVEEDASGQLTEAPPLLRAHLRPHAHNLHIQIPDDVTMLPQQIVILQQQIRMHVQLATTNFLQLFVHPVHWSYGPTYKEYLETLTKLVEKNPKSVVGVCNLKPAMELVQSWEKTVSVDTPENKKMIEFINQEIERGRRRFANNNLYLGEFHDTMKQVVANSPAILYPQLLPAAPYRADTHRRCYYLRAEDELIVLGLDQFWDYVDANPSIYKPRAMSHPNRRWGFSITVQLMVKHMFPWLPVKLMMGHIRHVRRQGGKDNPINKFFATREVNPVKHTLLPYNPKLTLYEQPEQEMPRVWVRYLAKTSKRFREYLYRHNSISGRAPTGVPIELGEAIEEPTKAPLPIDFTKVIISNRINIQNHPPKPQLADKFDIEITDAPVSQRVVFVPIQNLTQNSPILNATSSKTQEHILNQSTMVPEVQNAVTIPNTQAITSKAILNDVDPESIEPHNQYTQIASTTSIMNLKPNLIPSNKYRIIETNNGVFLYPLEPVTTVNTNVTPITTPKEICTTTNRDVLPDNKEHCECCLLLRNICQRQSLITEYFKPKRSVSKSCYCKNIKYKRISNKLRLLINNYKSSFQCNLEALRRMLRYKKSDESHDGIEVVSDSSNADDVAYVTSFHLRLLTKTGLAKNSYMKKRVDTALSRFNLDIGNPLVLANDLYKIFEVELVDMYKEFVGFLTPDQADSIGLFKDYFVRACAGDLMKKIEVHVTDSDERSRVLSCLQKVMHNNRLTSCQMCCSLLVEVDQVPKLAEYVFSLFPHRRPKETIKPVTEPPATKSVPEQIDTSQTTSNHVTIAQKQLVITPLVRNTNETTPINPLLFKPIAPKPLVIEPLIRNRVSKTPEKKGADESVSEDTRAMMDYEADQSSSDEDSDNTEPEYATEDSCDDPQAVIKAEEPEETLCTTLTATNIDQDQDSCESTNTSMLIVFEDESEVKPEAPEWKRDEDKLILEVLKEHIAPEDRRNKPILDILVEKNILDMITESLTNKTSEEVKNRVLYLLQFLILNDK